MNWPAFAIGYAYALVIGSILLWFVMDRMWDIVEEGKLEPMAWQRIVMGVIERTLYISSLLMNHGEFIAVWLGIKTAGGWKRWLDPAKGRYYFSNTLFGSGLSLLFAGVGYELILWIKNRQWSYAAIVPSLLIVATYILWWWLENKVDKKIRLACQRTKNEPTQ